MHPTYKLVTLSTLYAALLSPTASAQTQSPFGTATPAQEQAAQRVEQARLNALRNWQNLPQSLKDSLTSQFAGLTQEQRLGLLNTVPSLRNLPGNAKEALLAEIAKDVPLPAGATVTRIDQLVVDEASRVAYLLIQLQFQGGVTATDIRVNATQFEEPYISPYTKPPSDPSRPYTHTYSITGTASGLNPTVSVTFDLSDGSTLVSPTFAIRVRPCPDDNTQYCPY